MKFSILRGLPAILDGAGQPLMTDLRCGIQYGGDYYNVLQSMTSSGWSVTDHTAKAHGCCLTLAREGQGVTIQVQYEHTGADIPGAEDFIVLQGFLPRRVRTVLGSIPCRPNGIRTNEMQSPVETRSFLPGESMECADFTAWTDVDGRHFLAGLLTFKNYFGTVVIREDGSFEFRQDLERHPVANGEVLESDTFYFTECADLLQALPEYCSLSAQFMGGARLQAPVPSGYCTWYYYLNHINQQTIFDSAGDLVREPSLPVQYVQIDDGWQRSENFPDGMAACAKKIRDSGFTPGLWLSPLHESWQGDEISDLYARELGTGKITRCLDYSKPETCEMTRKLIEKVTRQWGFEYLKLDIITPYFGPYQFQDPHFNSLRNYRRCLEVIRQAVPENTFLLGCTAPFGPSVGLVDGMRVSMDIFERWDSVCNVFNAVLKRYYYHHRYFLNDADCLIIRQSENEDDQCWRRCIRTPEENRTFTSLMAASGGILMLSDKLRLLDQDQIQMLSCLFPQNTQAAVPLDLMESRIPGVLDCGSDGNTRVVILVNWDNREKTMGINTGYSHVFEFWSQKYWGIAAGRFEISVAPHGCQVLFLTQAEKPDIIGTDSVLIPRFVRTAENGRIYTSFHKKGETFFVSAHHLQGEGCIVTRMENGLFSVRQTGSNLSVCLVAD